MTEMHARPGERRAPVVVGYDGSDRGRDAVALGRLLGQMRDAPLHVAIVRPEPFLPDERRVLSAEELSRFYHARRRERDELTAEANALAPESEIEILEASSPARALYRLAEAEGSAIVVIGSSHHGAIGRIAPGSVSERLLSGAPCPVAVAPAGYADRAERRLHAIGVAYDGSAEARVALDAAERLAARLHGEVTAVGVAEPSPIAAPFGGGYQADMLDRAIREQVKAALDEAVDRAPGMVAAKGELRAGQAADELAEASRRLDLLVCGSRGYGPVRRVLLGSVTARLIRRAWCPVLVIRRGDAGALELDGAATAPRARSREAPPTHQEPRRPAR